MDIFFHTDQLDYAPKNEFTGSSLKPSVENPTRIELIKQALSKSTLDYDFKEPVLIKENDLQEIHDIDYINFLATVPDDCKEESPHAFAYPHARTTKHTSFNAKLGYYMFDPSTPVTPDTFKSAKASASAALASAVTLSNKDRVISLCRPPGHHAMKKVGGGYCFFNNVALAAQREVKNSKTVSVLDVDYHHGNGTQEIFYESSKVQYLSIHADPRESYPYYWGSVDEKGEGEGKGFNFNFPLPKSASEDQYTEALTKAIQEINEYNPDYVFLSLGLDIYHKDPVGGMNISVDYFETIGEKLSVFPKLGIFLEGGYSQEIGTCFVKVLEQVNR